MLARVDLYWLGLVRSDSFGLAGFGLSEFWSVWLVSVAVKVCGATTTAGASGGGNTCEQNAGTKDARHGCRSTSSCEHTRTPGSIQARMLLLRASLGREQAIHTLLGFCVSPLRRGQESLLSIVAILTDDTRRDSAISSHPRYVSLIVV